MPLKLVRSPVSFSNKGHASDLCHTPASISSEEAIHLANRGKLRGRGKPRGKTTRTRTRKGRSATNSVQRAFSDDQRKRGGTGTADEQDDEDNEEVEETGTPSADAGGVESE